MRISDWSSDVCSSDLQELLVMVAQALAGLASCWSRVRRDRDPALRERLEGGDPEAFRVGPGSGPQGRRPHCVGRSEEHTSELQSLMRISYAVFCLKKKKQNYNYETSLDNQPKSENR